MRIALIAAMTRKRVIGRDNRLPWHLPGDLRHFRELTLGKPVIMGRLTFESIGKALPGRTNIVISRRRDLVVPADVTLVSDTDAALKLAQAVAVRDGADECMVIGGGTIYAAFLERAQRIYVTWVDADIPGDTVFPEWDVAQWKEISQTPGGIDPVSGLQYSYAVLERNGGD
jgi:dihydrofolate reductase